MTAVLLALCTIGVQDARFEKFLVPWKPEADAPFYAIRVKIEPYAYRSDVDVSWMRKQAAEAYEAWQKSPKAPKAMFRAYLWQLTLRAAHYNADRDQDRAVRQELQTAIDKVEPVPPSAEFARILCSAQYGSSALKSLALRVLDQYPRDGLLLHWVQPNVLRFVPAKKLEPLRNLSAAFLKKHPGYWPARYTRAVSAMMVRDDVTLAGELPALIEARRRFQALGGKPGLGLEERKDIAFWLERLNRYIPGYEEIIKKGKGHLKARTYRGDPP